MCNLYATSNTVIYATLVRERDPDIASRRFTHVTEMMCVERYVTCVPFDQL